MKNIDVTGDYYTLRYMSHDVLVIQYSTKNIYATLRSLTETPYINASVRKIKGINVVHNNVNITSWTAKPIVSIIIIVSGIVL